MKEIVILGAFDRYNYGDNIMPILFEMFLEKFYPTVSDRYSLVYTALTESDLSRYKAKKTKAIADVFLKADDVHSIIVIGGEVLCASSTTLFLHMDENVNLASIIRAIKNKKLSIISDVFCAWHYRLPWEYPYIPKKIKSDVKVAFNTVGGGVSSLALGPRVHGVRQRLRDADFLSVRDSRTLKSLKGFCDPSVFPDSAIAMSYFATDEFLKENCRQDFTNLMQDDDYICFQAAPEKSGTSPEKCMDMLRLISKEHGLKIKLCPIGYANGHDDLMFLRKIEELSDGEFSLHYDLNVWEIMSVIRYSKLYIGTSLHGAITALSYSVPHLGLNPNILKLECFLSDWSIEPFNRCYSVDDMSGVVGVALKVCIENFRVHSNNLVKKALENNHQLVQALSLVEEEE
ncbi:MAG: polysaccharide pyruvyl transferase family protein [Colwellia sp.]